MDKILFSRRRAERFAQLLDEANGGRRHHIRSRADDDLAGLVAASQQFRAAQPAAEVAPDFRTSLRAMLVATAEREGIGATATGEPADHPTGVPHGLRQAPAGQRARARGAILVGVAVGAVAVSGISTASENAVPGDALYGMKRSTERAQLALASSNVGRGQLFLGFARNRLAEAEALRGDPADFASVLDDMDLDIRQAVRLLTASATQHADDTTLDTIDAFLPGQRQAVARLRDTGPRAQRQRVELSLDLLDLVRKRSEGLRAALSCRAAQPVRADSLGPQPQSCPVTARLTPTQSPPSSTQPSPAARDGASNPAQPPHTAQSTQPAFAPSPAVPSRGDGIRVSGAAGR